MVRFSRSIEIYSCEANSLGAVWCSYNHRYYIPLPGIAYQGTSKEHSALYQSTNFLCRVGIGEVGEGSQFEHAVKF